MPFENLPGTDRKLQALPRLTDGTDDLRIMDIQLRGQSQDVAPIGSNHVSGHIPPGRARLTRKRERHEKGSADEHESPTGG